MTKVDFISKFAEKSGYSKKDSRVILECMQEAITEAVVEDGELKLVGFGTFKLTESPAHEGRNPQTDEVMMIPAKKRMTFKCSQGIKDILNA